MNYYNKIKEELINNEIYKKVKYYIYISEKQKLSIRELRNRIESNEYERLPIDTKQKLITREENKVSDFIKNPILIKNSYNYENISEKTLKQLILEDLDSFLKELGEGFCYIENEYKIKLGDRYNYIDLLLFNYQYNCFVVLDLKVTDMSSMFENCSNLTELKFNNAEINGIPWNAGKTEPFNYTSNLTVYVKNETVKKCLKKMHMIHNVLQDLIL